MKRAPFVVAATVAGLAGVLGFHTRPARLGSRPIGRRVRDLRDELRRIVAGPRPAARSPPP